MRVLLFLTFGFAASCALCAYNAGITLWLVFGAGVAAAMLLSFAFHRKSAKVMLVIAVGAVFGFLWSGLYQVLYLQPLEEYNGKSIYITVTVTDYSTENYYGIGADGEIRLDDKTYDIRIYCDGSYQLAPGDRLTGQLQLQTTTGGATAQSDYQQGIGLYLTGMFQSNATLQKAEKLELKYYPAALRQKILLLLDQTFPQDTLPFARALLLGDTRLITYEEDTAYKVSGIRHVIAVSGLHISILFSLVYMAVGKRRWLTALLGIPVLVLFAAVAGFTPSVVRACTMQCLMILALLLKKEYDPPTALAAASLFMLLANPMSVLSVSLQLSVGSMAGIFLFCKRLHDWAMSGKLGALAEGKGFWSRVMWWCISSVTVTLSAMSLTIPLTAYYFGTVSIVGIITNLCCLWMISGIFYGIMLTCIIGAVNITAGQIIAAIVTVAIRFVKLISKSLSGLSFASLYTCSEYIVLWLVLCYVLLGLFLLSKKKKPKLLAICIVLSLVLAMGASAAEPLIGNYLVTVMDVGQGQCVLLRCGSRNYLVDCGSEHAETAADKAAGLLLSQGITALDGIIVTHFDADHANGVQYLMERVPAAALYLPDAPDETGFRESLSAAYPERIGWISSDIQFGDNDWEITIFAGDSEKPGNESSLCVLFQRQNCDILITGDRSIQMEDALLDKYTLPQLELLVVGHHGSASSTGFRLLQETKPAYAAISVGADNTYGHPTDQALGRLELAGCKILRTDIHGDIHFGR